MSHVMTDRSCAKRRDKQTTPDNIATHATNARRLKIIEWAGQSAQGKNKKMRTRPANKDTKEAMEINVGSNQWSGMKKKSESIAQAKRPIYLQAYVSSRPNTNTCRYWSTLNYMYPYHGVHP